MNNGCYDYIDGYDSAGNPVMRRGCFCGTSACGQQRNQMTTSSLVGKFRVIDGEVFQVINASPPLPENTLTTEKERAEFASKKEKRVEGIKQIHKALGL